LTCSDIPQDPRKSVVVRGDCHAVRHAPAHTMIMTVDGKCRVNATPSLVHVVACAAGAVAVPIQTAPPSRTTSTPSASRFRLGAAATPADSAGNRRIFAEQGHDDDAELVDQSPTAQSSPAPIIHRAPAEATTRPPRPVIMAASPPRLRLRCHDRLDGLIHGYALVTSYG
jgi:hypothetical protein